MGMLHRPGQWAEIIGLQKAALQRSFPGDDLPGLEAGSQAALLALLKWVFMARANWRSVGVLR